MLSCRWVGVLKVHGRRLICDILSSLVDRSISALIHLGAFADACFYGLLVMLRIQMARKRGTCSTWWDLIEGLRSVG